MKNLLKLKNYKIWEEYNKLFRLYLLLQSFKIHLITKTKSNKLIKRKLYQTKKNVTTICRRNFFDFSKYKDFNQ
jgi:hypothetical protein